MRKIDLVGFCIGSLVAGFCIGSLLFSALNFANVEQYEVRIVEAYDKAYDDGYQDGINDLLEDYYDLLIENAVLKERLNNNPNNEAYIEQIVDDFELTIELQQYYYQENITSHSFGDWLQINYPELYKRIESYF